MPTSAQALRTLPSGIAHTTETSGALKFRLSYSVPVKVTPLASADLPFNFKVAAAPQFTFEAGGEIGMSGDFIIRTYKPSPTDLVFGVFKKKASTIEVNFELAAGVAGELGKTDVLSAFLGALFPDAKPAEAGFSDDQSDALEEALESCASSNLAVALNGACAA